MLTGCQWPFDQTKINSIYAAHKNGYKLPKKESSEQFSAGMDTVSTQSNIAINTTNCWLCWVLRSWYNNKFMHTWISFSNKTFNKKFQFSEYKHAKCFHIHVQLYIHPFLYHIPDRSYSPSFWPNTCTIIGTDRIPCMPSLISNDIINVHNSRTELYRSSKFSWHEVYENNLVTPVFLSSYHAATIWHKNMT